MTNSHAPELPALLSPRVPPALGTAAGETVGKVAPVVAVVGADVGDGVGTACTVTRPLMSVGWNAQKYSKTPGELNMCEKLPPAVSGPESKPPGGGQSENASSHSVTVWKPATCCHVTVSPAVTVVSQISSWKDELQK
jgi:hypothetical protein